MLAAAAGVHLLCVPITLVLLLAFVSSLVGRPVSFSELFTVDPKLAALLYLGIMLQFVFAIVAAIGSYQLFHHRPGIAVGMIVAGVLATGTSIVFFGGIVGLVAGILSVAGGAVGKQRSTPMMMPPPYLPPSYVPLAPPAPPPATGTPGAPQQEPPLPPS